MIINVSFVPFPLYIQFEYHGVDATNCQILKFEKGLKADEMDIIASGWAYKHPNDKPDKNKGRKVALSDAMRSRVFAQAVELFDGTISYKPKYGIDFSIAENRREIWNAYHSRSPKYASYINQGKAA